jgi:ribosomal-protein-alanine N-acetyltransferase
MLPTLETKRLTIRALSDADIPALFEVFRDPESVRYWSHTALTDIAQAEELLRTIEKNVATGTFAQWGIARRDDDLVIGTCTLHRILRDHRRAELGYILRRDHWGRGLAAEALTRLFEHAFGTLGLHRLEADIDPRNAGSIKLIERLGFRREGLLRERYFVAGDIQDSVIYGLLAPDWSTR